MDIDEQYQACLAYMYEKLPMFTRVGAAAYKPNLNNIIALCAAIGNPHHQFKSIHIAGTNGKGSCSHMLAAVLQSAGYKTGLYTSPHIHDFRERIKLNGVDISKEKVIQFIDQHRLLIEQLSPSFFEITVALAFDYFAKEKVDIAVIEVGLGGLLDSTNIITPEVSVITNISLDHTQLLGATTAEIATQKAGIIKPNIPVVIGESQEDTETVFVTKAILNHTQVYFADTLFDVVHKEWKTPYLMLKVVDLHHKRIEEYSLGLLGQYQSKNLKTVLTAIGVLRSKSWNISHEALRNGLRDVKKLTGMEGRFDIVQQKPTVILDVSHNEAGIRELFEQVTQMTYSNLHIVCGFVNDKDVAHILALFPKQAQYYFTQAQIPRALPYASLTDMAQQKELKGQGFKTVQEAMQEALARCVESDIVLVTGSFFILQEAYEVVKHR